MEASPLRSRILAGVGALALLCLAGSSLSLYQIHEVNRSLDGIHRVVVPLGKSLVQLKADADLYAREFDRRLSAVHWQDPHWKPKAVPRWLPEVLQSGVGQVGELVQQKNDWSESDADAAAWRDWAEQSSVSLRSLEAHGASLMNALEKHDLEGGLLAYQAWQSVHEDWSRRLQWAVETQHRTLRQAFSQADLRVSRLKLGLEGVLVVVVSLSLLLLWLGERALRPLRELTRLVRDIAQRGGVKREDKNSLPQLMLRRNDEVSDLAREFHRMATSLLEREKEVDAQRSRLEEQNRMLRRIGELNRDILNSIDSVLVVTDLEGRITQANPGAARWLGVPIETLRERKLVGDPALEGVCDLGLMLQRLRQGATTLTVSGVTRADSRFWSGALMPLRDEDSQLHGAILVLEDKTHARVLESRLRHAEKLAAVGQMSAQVAHEIRNPLHSIGLEAELALDRSQEFRAPELRQSIASILQSVDRLEKITGNYLRYSRLSPGESVSFDLGEALEAVLSTYAPTLEQAKIAVDWTRPSHALRVRGDRELLEQAIGNLLRNSIQALEGRVDGSIRFELDQLESGKILFKIRDNGPGIAAAVREKLFTPFVTTKAQGTGLGLSFVRKVVDDFGGEALCPVVPVGEGAAFELRLPEGSPNHGTL